MTTKQSASSTEQPHWIEEATPGPWSTDGRYIYEHLNRPNRALFEVLPARPVTARIGNARLAAAAPELLDALADCYDQLVYICETYDLNDANIDGVVVDRSGELLRQLLTDEQRKARGEQP